MRAPVGYSMAENRLTAEDLPSITPSPARECARWYVVHAQSHQEVRAVQNLQRQGFTTFCPSVRRTVRHARKQSSVLAPLFPNYLFIRLDLSYDLWRSVNGTRGVIRLITCGDTPLPVPHGVVEDLQSRTQDDGAMTWTSSFKLGDAVRISSGPFANLVGVLEHLDSAGRVRVLLDLLGRSVTVALRGDALQPAA